MRQALKLHPASLCSAATRIDVEVTRPCAGRLVLTYAVTGTISGLRLPPVAAAARTDALWRHTCFEAFIRPDPDAAYYEFNFAPSTQWAAYRFDSYRSGMRVATEISAPRIDVQVTPERYTLRAAVTFDDALWRVALAAVIEETSGRQSYWALAHPPGNADFHHSDSFAHEFS